MPPDQPGREFGRYNAFVQNLRRGHYELWVDVPPALRVAAAFTQLADAI